MNAIKRYRRVGKIFLGSFGILFVGMGIFPLLPLYAAEFGATPGMVGVFLAVINSTLSVGMMIASPLANWAGARRLLTLSGLAGIPALISLGFATALWQIIVSTGVVWFVAGIGLALLNVYVGLVVDSEHRGQAFSLMALGAPLGALMGGLVVGELVSRFGYGPMLLALSVVWMLFPLVGFFGLQDIPLPDRKPVQRRSTRCIHLAPNASFLLLLVASLLSTGAINVGRMGVTISMQSLSFSAAEISSTSTISGLATIPIILVSGFLADRMGRKYLLVIGYLLTAVAILVLGLSLHLWHFWAAASVILISRSLIDSLTAALAADVQTKDEFSRNLPVLYGLSGFSGVASMALAGYVIEWAGVHILYLGMALISAVAGLMLLGLLNSQGKVRLPSRPLATLVERAGRASRPVGNQPAQC